MGNKIADFKTFENMETVSSKNLNTWSVVNNKKVDPKFVETSKLLVNKLKGNKTNLMDWLESKGFSVMIEVGEYQKGILDGLGQNGFPYTFYLIQSWTEESYLRYLRDINFNQNDINLLPSILKIDSLNDLSIYGSSINMNYIVIVDGEKMDLEFIITYYDENKENWSDFNVELEIEQMYDIKYINDCPLWGAKIPLKFNGIPSEGSIEYRLLCEMGLFMASWQIHKMMKLQEVNSYSELYRRGHIEQNIMMYDTDLFIEYLNMSNINITKNTDLKEVTKTSYNLYKSSKLFHENHEDRINKIPISLVEEFIKINPSFNLSNLK